MGLIAKIASPSSVRHSKRYRCRVDPIYRFAADWSARRDARRRDAATSLFTSARSAVAQSLSRTCPKFARIVVARKIE